MLPCTLAFAFAGLADWLGEAVTIVFALVLLFEFSVPLRAAPKTTSADKVRRPMVRRISVPPMATNVFHLTRGQEFFVRVERDHSPFAPFGSKSKSRSAWRRPANSPSSSMAVPIISCRVLLLAWEHAGARSNASGRSAIRCRVSRAPPSPVLHRRRGAIRCQPRSRT